MFEKRNFFIFIILFIISLLLCLDLLTNNGRPASFDGLTHVTNIAQYYKALKDGDFPVRWQDGFANYGMPIPIFGHQITSYIGGVITFLTNNPLVSFNIVILLGSFAGTVGMYLFLSSYFDIFSSLLGSFLFTYAPYRIINIYVRGAAPEFFATLFFPLILLSLKKWIEKNDYKWFLSFVILTSLLIQTHPIAGVIQFIFIIPYYLFVLKGFRFNKLIAFSFGILGAIGIASYYILPLLLEFKYFYYGQQSEIFLPNQFLTLNNFIKPSWPYFFRGDILTRGHYLHIGSIEMIIVVLYLLYFLAKGRKNNSKFQSLSIVAFCVFFIYSFLMSSYASFLYMKIKLLGNIQHQWRMLSGLIIIPPILGAFLTSVLKEKLRRIIVILIIITIIIIRFPQLYGKNYVIENKNNYYSNKENLYATVYNTIWTGKTEDYPAKKAKGEIIEGKGKLIKRDEHNSWRQYEIDASTEVRLADYTFYFPGWKVFVDKKEVPIEFQDMNYRGVITYRVPPGKHTILVKFTDTKVRLLANLISIFSIGVLGFLIIFRKKLFHHLPKKRS